MDKFDLLKSHINAFTRKDGSVVQAHDDKRVGTTPIAAHADALRQSSKPGDLDHEDNQIAAGYMKSGDHKSLAGHIKNLDTGARDHILDHVHPDHREGLGFKQLDMDRSKKRYDQKFPVKPAKAAQSDSKPAGITKHRQLVEAATYSGGSYEQHSATHTDTHSSRSIRVPASDKKKAWDHATDTFGSAGLKHKGTDTITGAHRFESDTHTAELSHDNGTLHATVKSKTVGK